MDMISLLLKTPIKSIDAEPLLEKYVDFLKEKFEEEEKLEYVRQRKLFYLKTLKNKSP